MLFSDTWKGLVIDSAIDFGGLQLTTCAFGERAGKYSEGL